MGGDGFGTYLLTVQLGQNKGPLGLYFKDVGTAAAYHLDGRLVHRSGQTAKTAEGGRAEYRHAVVRYLPTSGTLEIAIWVSNYHHRQGGLWSEITLGTYDQVSRDYRFNEVITYALISVIFVFGLYHLVMVTIRPYDRTSFWFGAFCILVATRMAGTGFCPLSILLPDLPWAWIVRILYLATYLTILSFACYLKQLIPNQMPGWAIPVTVSISLLFALTAILMPVKMATKLMPGYQAFLLGALMIGMWWLVRAIRARVAGSRTLILSFVILTGAVANDVFHTRQIINTGLTAQYAVLVFILIQAMILSRRFGAMYRTIEEQRNELGKLNALNQQELDRRKQAEVELKQERDQLEHITRALGAGIVIVDRDYRIVWANEVMNGIFGPTRGRTCFRILNQKEHVCDNCGPRQIFENGAEHVVHEQQGQDANGELIISEIIATPIREDGEVVAALELVIPITERKKAEEAQQQLRERLQESKKMEAIATLAGGVAHEFNNTLTGVVGYLDLISLKKDSLSENVDQWVEKISQATTKMTSLTQQLLAYSRGGKYREQPIDLAAVVRESIALLHHNISEHIEISTNFEEGNGYSIKGDPTQIQMAISAVMNNAVEALDTKGRIEISLSTAHPEPGRGPDEESPGPEKFRCLTITDSGVGIEAAILDKVAEPFFSTKFIGRGLGLAATEGIMTNHRGHLRIRSEEGFGTSVYLYFPID